MISKNIFTLITLKLVWYIYRKKKYVAHVCWIFSIHFLIKPFPCGDLNNHPHKLARPKPARLYFFLFSTFDVFRILFRLRTHFYWFAFSFSYPDFLLFLLLSSYSPDCLSFRDRFFRYCFSSDFRTSLPPFSLLAFSCLSSVFLPVVDSWVTCFLRQPFSSFARFWWLLTMAYHLGWWVASRPWFHMHCPRFHASQEMLCIYLP